MKAPCGACATCEQCPYDDCTWNGVSTEEWAAAKDMDADARHAVESKQAAQRRAYYEANREKIADQQRAYREANREKIADRQRAYREANREKIAEYNRNYYAKRKKAKQCAAPASPADAGSAEQNLPAAGPVSLAAYNARKKKAARTDKTAVKLATSGLARKLGGN